MEETYSCAHMNTHLMCNPRTKNLVTFPSFMCCALEMVFRILWPVLIQYSNLFANRTITHTEHERIAIFRRCGLARLPGMVLWISDEESRVVPDAELTKHKSKLNSCQFLSFLASINPLWHCALRNGSILSHPISLSEKTVARGGL